MPCYAMRCNFCLKVKFVVLHGMVCAVVWCDRSTSLVLIPSHFILCFIPHVPTIPWDWVCVLCSCVFEQKKYFIFFTFHSSNKCIGFTCNIMPLTYGRTASYVRTDCCVGKKLHFLFFLKVSVGFEIRARAPPTTHK